MTIAECLRANISALEFDASQLGIEQRMLDDAAAVNARERFATDERLKRTRIALEVVEAL